MNPLQKYSWKDIYDEWYGEPKKEKTVVDLTGKAHGNSKPIIIEDDNHIKKVNSINEASYELGCSPSSVSRNVGKTFMGVKLRRK